MSLGNDDSLDGIVETMDGSPTELSEDTDEVRVDSEVIDEAVVVDEVAEDPVVLLQKELESVKLNWARDRADFINARKHMHQEMSAIRRTTIANFVQSLISVIDNLDLVLAAPTDDPAVKNFVIGVDMIRSEFLQALGRENIKPVVDVGDEFDPYLMEAIEFEEREGVVGDTVENVYKKAYVMQGEGDERRILRLATVKVVRGKKLQAALNEDENKV